MNPSHRGILSIATLAIATMMGGCATPTPYQPYRAESAGGVHGGYSEQRLGEDRFRVMFHGNELTSRERVETYLLYRAAELTVTSGNDWFEVRNRNTEHDVETHTQHHAWGSYPYWQPQWQYYRRGYGWEIWRPGYGEPFWADHVDVTTVESFEVAAEIQVAKGAAPAGNVQAFDARKILAQLGPTIVYPKGS